MRVKCGVFLLEVVVAKNGTKQENEQSFSTDAVF